MKTAIIGGSGKMGRWFASFLSAEGKEVIIIGREQQKLEKTAAELGISFSTDIKDAGQADAVIVSVPVDCFEDVIRQLSPYTHPQQVILDVTSVKTLPVEAMQQHISKGRVLGTHPVFGPGARSLANQNFVLTPTNEQEKELALKVEAYLKERGASVRLMTPQQHDDMMAVILGLAHYIAIVSADTISDFERLKDMEAVGGITYKVLLTLVESVISEDPSLYASLQMNLPRLPHYQQLFQQKGEEWAELVRQQDKQQFIQRMKEIRKKLEAKNPDFGKAYDNMYKIADNL